MKKLSKGLYSMNMHGDKQVWDLHHKMFFLRPIKQLLKSLFSIINPFFNRTLYSRYQKYSRLRQRVSHDYLDWANYQNMHNSKSISVVKVSFCQNDPPIGESFWQNTSLVTHILFELHMPILIFSPVQIIMRHHLLRKKLLAPTISNPNEVPDNKRGQFI